MNDPKLTRRDMLKIIGVTPMILLECSKHNSTALFNPPQKPPNILILVFDSLSARNVSLYGYPRKTTPNLERFAQRATVYHRHYASGNFTTPGTASILTGVYPWTHRALNMRDQTLPQFTDQNIFSLLNHSYHTFAYTHNTFAYIHLQRFRKSIDNLLKISDLALYSDSFAEKLANSDYFVTNETELLTLKNESASSSSLVLSLFDKKQRLNRVDEINRAYHKQFPRGLPNCPTGKDSKQCYTVEDAFEWLESQITTQANPFLGYIHINPPHSPYNPHREFIGMFKDSFEPPEKPEHHFSENDSQNKLNRLRRQYDEFIAYADSRFGRLFDFMLASGALNNTILIVTSDHGEMFERGIQGHVTPTLYEPIIHIPLIIFHPKQNARRDIFIPTNNVDLLPTLAQLSDQDVPDWCEGRVLPGFDEGEISPDRSIFTVEGKQNPKHGPLKEATFAVIRGNQKLIHYQGYPGFEDVNELYDLENDPEEITDIYSNDDPIATKLKIELESTLILSTKY